MGWKSTFSTFGTRPAGHFASSNASVEGKLPSRAMDASTPWRIGPRSLFLDLISRPACIQTYHFSTVFISDTELHTKSRPGSAFQLSAPSHQKLPKDAFIDLQTHLYVMRSNLYCNLSNYLFNHRPQFEVPRLSAALRPRRSPFRSIL
jgi:hypothetical protein